MCERQILIFMHSTNCDKHTNDAFVLTDAVAFSSAHFGAGTGTIYMDYVGCTGSENNLIDCSRSTSFGCFGSHSQDAGVRCQGLMKQCIIVAGLVLFLVY